MARLARRAHDWLTHGHRSSGRGGSLRATTRPRARPGQSLTEFALVVPLFMLLLLAIFGFGLIFQNKVAMDNAVRDGARLASTQPDQWTNADTTGNPLLQNTIEGRVQNSGGIAGIPNVNNADIPGGSATGIGIRYSVLDQSTGATTLCGYYDASSGAFVAMGTDPNGAAYTEQSCLQPGRLVTVSAIIHYTVPVPIVSGIVKAFFSGGVPIVSSATMLLEQCGGC